MSIIIGGLLSCALDQGRMRPGFPGGGISTESRSTIRPVPGQDAPEFLGLRGCEGKRGGFPSPHSRSPSPPAPAACSQGELGLPTAWDSPQTPPRLVSAPSGGCFEAPGTRPGVARMPQDVASGAKGKTAIIAFFKKLNTTTLNQKPENL